MEYKLYKGYIFGQGYQDPAHGIYEVSIYKSKEDVGTDFVFHTSESEWEAQLWIDSQTTEHGYAQQADIDELNKKEVTPGYPDYIMEKVRQRLSLDPYDTSKDAKINDMNHNTVFFHCLEWEGIIGYGPTIHGWINDIYGVDLS